MADPSHSYSLQAMFGRSKMRVTPLGVQLGRLLAPSEGSGCLVARTTVRVANVSEQMPLQWSALAPLGVDLDRTHGELPGYGAGGRLGWGAGLGR